MRVRDLAAVGTAAIKALSSAQAKALGSTVGTELLLELFDSAITFRARYQRHEDLLALTDLVYPHFFRARTMEMGRYFGIYDGARLAAIIGERLGTERHVEMSAICTHPDYVGRGLASRLTAFLTNDILTRGATPFLHVSLANTRAKALYEHLGYRLRAELPFFALRRP